MMDMAADDAVTPTRHGKLGQCGFKVGDVGHGRLDTLLDVLRERIVRLPAMCTIAVVDAVEP